MIGAITPLTAGSWVEKKPGSPWYVDGKSGDWKNPVIHLICKANGNRCSVPLSEFGKTWKIVADENGIKGNPTGQVLGGFNAA